eukprot:g1823.t1
MQCYGNLQGDGIVSIVKEGDRKITLGTILSQFNRFQSQRYKSNRIEPPFTPAEESAVKAAALKNPENVSKVAIANHWKIDNTQFSESSIVQLFEEADTNKDGKMTMKELGTLLGKIGMVKGSASGVGLNFFHNTDLDGNGDLDLHEMLSSTTQDAAARRDAANFNVAKCAENAGKANAVFQTAVKLGKKELDEEPGFMEDWCLQIAKAAKAVAKEEGLHGWKVSCSRAREEMESSIKQDGSVEPFNATAYCKVLAAELTVMTQSSGGKFGKFWVFDDSFSKHPGVLPYTAPLATPRVRVQRLLKHPNPCCEAHGGAGCYDQDIASCVCDPLYGDPSCCSDDQKTGGWDLRCVELVEKLQILNDGNTLRRCGRCPGVECLEKLKSCTGCYCRGERKFAAPNNESSKSKKREEVQLFAPLKTE